MTWKTAFQLAKLCQDELNLEANTQSKQTALPALPMQTRT